MLGFVASTFRGWFTLALLGAGLAACGSEAGAPADGTAARGKPAVATAVSFNDLPGWREDNPVEAVAALRRSCPKLIAGGDTRMRIDAGELRASADDWRRICAAADQGAGRDAAAARGFFERHFQAWSLGGPGVEAKYTAYYEPEIKGSKAPSRRFTVPVFKRPPDLNADTPYLTRTEIENGALRGKGLEVAWVEDAIGLFEIQVQGSGRIALSEGGVMRLGFDGTNNRPYTAIGKVLVDDGSLAKGEVTWPRIRQWLLANPAKARDVMRRNERFVFFRDMRGGGPLGAQGVNLTSGRSLAIDPAHVPYGLPVWVDTQRPAPRAGTTPFRRLMIAQDTGGDIKGPARGDIFLGAGAGVGDIAGRFNAGGRMYVLLPKR